MFEIIVYAILIWAGYVLGSITGWAAANNNVRSKEIEAKKEKPEKLCENYSHLRNSPAAIKVASESSIIKINNDDLYDKVYDVDIVEDEYKIDKII